MATWQESRSLARGVTRRYSTISVDNLATAGVRMQHADAVAICREVALRASRGELPGLPSVYSIHLGIDGAIEVEGPIATGRHVRSAARLLEGLVARASEDVSDPAAFRLIVARAYAGDESAFTSLEEFARALTPFAAPDVGEVARTLVGVANALADLESTDESRQTAPRHRQTERSGVLLRPARDRRRQMVGQPARKITRPVAVAVLGLATVVLGARCYFVYQRQEPGVIRDTRASSSLTPAPSPSIVSAAQILPTAAFSPSFAATTSAMFYHSGSGARSAIMRADMRGDHDILRITELVNDLASNFHPRPSPDSRSIAFDSNRDGERGVYLADANGRGVRRVSGDGFAAVPSWSPDGRQLAFVRAEAGRPRVWNIWTLNVATGSMRRITSHPFGQPWGAAWFPEGDRIAYSHEDRLIVRSLSGDSIRVFKSPIPRRLVRTPAISPDGQRIVFQVRHDGVWMLDLATGRMRRVLEDPSAEEFAWSADGGRVAYHSRHSGNWGVWMIAPL